MSPIHSNNDTNYDQPSEIYEYTSYDFDPDFDPEIEYQEEQYEVSQNQDQFSNSQDVYPPREHTIQRLFDILSSIEITRHYATHISVDDIETMLGILDRSIKECEDYYASYRNRHALFFLIINRAKEFLHFIREDQARGLPSTDNVQV
jgi:hypothetical protein